MSWPSRVLISSFNPLQTLNICGDTGDNLTASGTNAATAFPIVNVFSRFGTVVASTGALLPVAEKGMDLAIANDGGHTLTVYARSGSTIDGASSVTIDATKRRIFIATSLTVWVSILGA